MTWLCAKCGNTYAGNLPPERYCYKCLNPFQHNPLSMKTKDKVKSSATTLTQFEIPSPIKDHERAEVHSWTKLHEHKKNLKRNMKSGKLIARETFNGGKKDEHR